MFKNLYKILNFVLVLRLLHSKKESCYFNKIFVELAACQSNKIFCYYDNKINFVQNTGTKLLFLTLLCRYNFFAKTVKLLFFLHINVIKNFFPCFNKDFTILAKNVIISTRKIKNNNQCTCIANFLS